MAPQLSPSTAGKTDDFSRPLPPLLGAGPSLVWCLGMEIPDDVRKARNPSHDLLQHDAIEPRRRDDFVVLHGSK